MARPPEHSQTSDRLEKDARIQVDHLTFAGITQMYCWSTDAAIKNGDEMCVF